MKAIELDVSLAAPYATHGFISQSYDYDLIAAEKQYKHAIELNPSYSTAHMWYGATVLSKTGRFAEAIAETKRAQALDPLSLVMNKAVGLAYLRSGQYDKAMEQFFS